MTNGWIKYLENQKPQ